jgi:bifunctional non-homologous end joining protein LigD
VPVYESGWFVVGGYVLGIGRKEEPVAGLLLGEPAAGGLQFAGIVQGGLPRGFETALESFTSPVNPFIAGPSVARLVYWLTPLLVCEVRHAGRDPEGRLRFPVFVTLRPDLAVDACEPRERVELTLAGP